MKTLKHFLLIVFMPILGVMSQNITTDSLGKQSYKYLLDSIGKYFNDSVKGSPYAHAYLQKAKENNDTTQVANGFYYLSNLSDDSVAHKYIDSILLYTKNFESFKYPTKGYLTRGVLYYSQGKFKEALDQYLIALKYAKEKNNIYHLLAIKMNIGLLKNTLGEREEALALFKEYVDIIQKNDIESKEYYLVGGMYALADSYMYNKKLDSADIFIEKGMKKALSLNDSLMYSYFVMTSGVNNYYKGRYTFAIDSLLKAKEIANEKNLMLEVNLYMGNALFALDKIDEAIAHYLKMDSILISRDIVIPKFMTPYKKMAKYYKDQGDYEKQLYSINRLLKHDSILRSNEKYLFKNITKEYDIPELLKEKEDVIVKLKKNNLLSGKAIVLLILTLLIVLGFMFYFINKNQGNKKKFRALLDEIEKRKNLPKETPDTKKIEKEINETAISSEVVEKIIAKLHKFEQSNAFIKKKYTLQLLAKDFDTNYLYLSKIINKVKNTSFTTYLNNLRVEYAINRLKEDRIFRSYTIKAIAEESGFNSSQTFSTAFRKKAGINPSYFIKQLDNEKNS